MRASLGRESELAAVDRFLESVPQGLSGLLIEGDTGIGKTTLLKDALDQAERGGSVVLMANPGQAEMKQPFAGLGDLVHAAGDDALADLPDPQHRALDVALLRADAPASGIDHRAVSLAVLGVLRALARAAPIVLAIDDVQWLDASSARALQFALRRLGEEAIGVITTVRLEDEQIPLRLERLIPGERLVRLTLGPLERTQLDELLRSRIDWESPPSVLVDVHRISGGNPLFALEIAEAHARRARRGLASRPLAVPATLRGLVRDRLSVIPESAMDTLLAVAALSQPSVAAVAAAVGSDERAERDIATAVERGVLEVAGDRLAFAHPLIASILYSEATLQARQSMHRRLAAIAPDPEERARHLALATFVPDAGVAGQVEDAARQAQARGAPEVAADLWEESRRLTPVDAGDDRWRRTIGEAECRFGAGDPHRATTLLEELVATATSAPRRAEALRRLGLIRYHEDSYSAAADLFRDALREAAGDAPLEALIHADLAWAGLMYGDFPAALDHARSALKLAEQLGDQTAVADALTAVAAAGTAMGEDVGPDLLERARDMDDRADFGVERRPSRTFGLVLKWADDLDSARSRFLELNQRAVERGDESAVPLLLYHLSELECRAGNWELATRYADDAAAAAARTAQEPVRAAALYAKALVDAHKGEVESARRGAEQAMALAEQTGASTLVIQILGVLGFLELSLGNPAETHRLMGRVTDVLPTLRLRDPTVVRSLPDEIEALVALGDTEEAEGLIETLEQAGRPLGRVWALVAAARCRGLLAGAMGELTSAVQALERSVQLGEKLGQPFELGRSLLLLGEVQRRSKQKRAARHSLERAGQIFEQLGAALWAKKARSELDRVGSRFARADELTPTERQIAQLVAAGRRNREVANSLFLSTKSVEGHLTTIYQKLGVRSRSELAARMAGAAEPGGVQPRD
jgi:DNA-binding CsgD family transcriptional regulator/Cdc6-like AAA superfamily ATPase